MATTITGNTIDVNTAVLNRLSTDGTIVDLQKDGTTVGSIISDSGSIMLGSGDVGVYFDAASDRILPMNITTGSVRNDAIDIGGNPHRFKDLYLSGGVVFGPASASNVSSQTLDSYEEGTFTPTWIATNGSFGTIAYANRDAKYVKVGNVVHVTGEFYTTGITIGTATGELRIGGLPFTNGMAGNGVVSLKGDIRLFSGEVPWAGNVNEGTNYIALYYKTSITGPSQTSQVVDLATSGTGNIIGFSSSYYLS